MPDTLHPKDIRMLAKTWTDMSVLAMIPIWLNLELLKLDIKIMKPPWLPFGALHQWFYHLPIFNEGVVKQAQVHNKLWLYSTYNIFTDVKLQNYLSQFVPRCLSPSILLLSKSWPWGWDRIGACSIILSHIHHQTLSHSILRCLPPPPVCEMLS